MSDEIPVIEYESIQAFILGYQVRIYEDGHVFFETRGFSRETGNYEKTLQEFSISPEQVEQYAERIVKTRFFDLPDRYSVQLFGGFRTFSLNYRGRSKKIVCEAGADPTFTHEFHKITEELEAIAIVEQQSRKIG